MSDEVLIEQKQGIGNTGTQIGQQIVYNGISPEDASKLAIELFMDNFPKLKEQARKEVEKSVQEFCDTTIKKLIDAKLNDFSAFSTPDIQYILVEAQKQYARFGNADLLDILSDLVVQRVISNENNYFKIVLDKAISIVSNLSPRQLDTLTLMFYYKCVKFNSIKTLKDLEHLFYISNSAFSPCSRGGYSLLNSLGCLELDLGSVCDRISKTYSFGKNDVEKICPDNIKNINADYSPSHVGVIIAIINSNNKTDHKFDPHIWIHD